MKYIEHTTEKYIYFSLLCIKYINKDWLNVGLFLIMNALPFAMYAYRQENFVRLHCHAIKFKDIPLALFFNFNY